MKKQLITVALLFITCLSAWAQKEYRLNKSTGKLYINLNGAIIEGYDGNEIIFSSQKAQDEEEDERAKGLQALSSSGYKDNTGLGINVTEEGQEVHVNLIGNSVENGLLNIRVPKQMSIVFNYNKSFYAEPVTIRNVKGEIELNASFNPVVLENNSGPMNVTTIHGSVDATFENDIKGPVSIISIYDHVDVALPPATKANLELGTNYGKLYAAGEFDIAVERDTSATEVIETRARDQAGLSVLVARSQGTAQAGTAPTPPNPPAAAITGSGSRSISGILYAGGGSREFVKGTLNGGGINLIFKSTHSNVYLRTK